MEPSAEDKHQGTVMDSSLDKIDIEKAEKT